MVKVPLNDKPHDQTCLFPTSSMTWQLCNPLSAGSCSRSRLGSGTTHPPSLAVQKQLLLTARQRPTYIHAQAAAHHGKQTPGTWSSQQQQQQELLSSQL
jgi:hypothetical protein